ncbi:MAG: OsmC family protein [Propionibacteriaceae bacterium]|nr:OsmC family protein [Propionibacteriaceae bacterium]
MTHTYAATLSWQGSTRDGYRSYSRTHAASAPPAEAALSLTADPKYRGDASQLNPEQLLLMSASSCQLLSFLAEAALRKVDVLGYDDAAEAFMDDTDGPMRITRIVLRPVIRVAVGTDVDEVVRLVHRGHDLCFIANSLTSTIEIEPRIVF